MKLPTGAWEGHQCLLPLVREQESAGCRLKMQGSRPEVGSAGLGGALKSALEMLKERIIFIVGYFLPSILFFGFLFVLNCISAPWNFGKGM